MAMTIHFRTDRDSSVLVVAKSYAPGFNWLQADIRALSLLYVMLDKSLYDDIMHPLKRGPMTWF
jgi:hypothetical protein